MKNPILRGIALFLFVTFIVFALVLAAPSQNEGKTTPSNPKNSFDANTKHKARQHNTKRKHD